MPDLYHAGREELIARVVTQGEALADRDRRIADLEGELATQPVAPSPG